MTTEPELVLERRGMISIARLNRPEARNALSPSLLMAIGEAVVDAEEDPDVRALVLTGTGPRAFCAGMDLRTFADGDASPAGPSTDAFIRLMHGDARVPVIGAANGSAVGGGLELLLGCDLVVASVDARLGLPEVQRGLFPGGSGTTLARRVPMAIALELTLTGDLVTAERALAAGLVNAVVAPDQVLAVATAYAERIAANAPLGVAACRELVRLWPTDAAAATARLAEWQTLVFSSVDAREGATAFVEKRPPVWTGA